MTDEERKAKHAAYMRKYMADNPDKRRAMSERRKKKRLSDPEWAEAQRVRGRLSYAKNPQRYLDQAAKWQKDNPAQYKENQQRYYDETRDIRCAKAAAWKKANPEKAKINSINYAHKRRVRKMGGDEEGCRTKIAFLRRKATFRCAICGEEFATRANLHVDHIIPLSKGGSHIPSNLQATCRFCNLSKSDKVGGPRSAVA